MSLRFTACAIALTIFVTTPAIAGDPGSYLGVNCGKAGALDEKQKIPRYFIKRNVATLNLAADLGLGWARCGGGPEQWHAGGRPSPENFRDVIDHASAVGVRVYLYVEYRGDINAEAITDFDWRAVGRAFAETYGDRVACYGILNEVDHVRSPHPPGDVAAAVAEFAAGVKSVDPTLLVSTPAIGGTPMEVARADAHLKALAPLLNDGRLDVLNLHSYHDSRPKKPHWSNIDDSAEWSPSRNFLRAKRAAGITADVRFAAGEFNYRNWDGTDEERAVGFMTALWDQLMVVGRPGGERVGLFSLPYNVPDDRPERQTTMARNFEWTPDGSFVWEPNEKGRVLRTSVAVTDGAEFLSCDPHATGTATLRGGGKTVWVWHNRRAFSSLAGVAEVELVGVPRSATSVRLYTATSDVDRRAETFKTDGGRVVLRAADLPSEQTLLFVADGVDGGDPAVRPR